MPNHGTDKIALCRNLWLNMCQMWMKIPSVVLLNCVRGNAP